MKSRIPRSDTQGLKIWAAAALAVAFLAGCSSATEPEAEDVPDALRAAFDSRMEQVQSEFAQELLSDYEFTDDEFLALRDRYQSCIQEAGFTIEFSPEGVASYPPELEDPATADPFAQAESECGEATDFPVLNAFYQNLLFDPESKGFFAVVAECLYERGLTDELLSAPVVDIMVQDGIEPADSPEWKDCMRLSQ